jgi:hypothetical protein
MSLADHYAAVAAPPLRLMSPSLVTIGRDGRVGWLPMDMAAGEVDAETPLEAQQKTEYGLGRAAWVVGYD